jgi:hypothetical protein
MEVKLNDVPVLQLNTTKQKVIKNDIHEDEFSDDMARRLNCVLTHKYEACYERLKKEWEPKLIARGASSLPTDKDAFAELIFSQPDYLNRKQRDLLTQGQ